MVDIIAEQSSDVARRRADEPGGPCGQGAVARSEIVDDRRIAQVGVKIGRNPVPCLIVHRIVAYSGVIGLQAADIEEFAVDGGLGKRRGNLLAYELCASEMSWSSPPPA